MNPFFIFIPVLSWVLTLLCLLKLLAGTDRRLAWREAFIYASVLWGAYLTVATELLSAANLLTFLGVYQAWKGACVCAAFGLFLLRNKPWPDFSRHSFCSGEPFLKFLLGFISVSVVVTGFIALAAVPNTWDAMSYHLSRVAHWLAQKNLTHYPTHIVRQLFLSPWAEFAIAHFELLSGTDRSANLVQWFSFLGSAVGVSLIARELGARLRGEVFSALIFISIPMAVLQASSTQTDGTAAFWLVCFVWCVLRKVQSKDDFFTVWGIGLSLGLAILTKPTSYIFAFPFCLWLFAHEIRMEKIGAVRNVFVWTILFLALNAGHFSRNYSLFGSVLGPDEEGKSEIHRHLSFSLSPLTLTSNMLKDMSLHMGTPWPAANQAIEHAIQKMHDTVGVNINDTETTFNKIDFRVNSLSRHEDLAGNPLHLFLIIITLTALLLRKEMRASPVFSYAFVLVLAYALCSFLIKWSPFLSRLKLPLFVLWAPAIGYVMSECATGVLFRWAAVAIWSVSLWWLLGNETRPIWGAESVLKTNAIDQYFFNRPHAKKSYEEMIRYIREKNFKRVGLMLFEDEWEYPFWVLLNKYNKNVRMAHVYVTKNPSRDIAAPIFEPDVVVCSSPWIFFNRPEAEAFSARYGLPFSSSDRRLFAFEMTPKNAH